jgi:hypothetical protein
MDSELAVGRRGSDEVVVVEDESGAVGSDEVQVVMIDKECSLK